MDKSRSSLVVLILSILLPAAWLAAAPRMRAIHAEGVPADKSLWVVQSWEDSDTTQPPQSTSLWSRREGSSKWKSEPGIPFGVTQVTHLRDSLVVLLDSGQWLMVGQSTGWPLPDQARILALTGNDNELLAIGQPGAPTTLPTTNATSKPSVTFTTRPATTTVETAAFSAAPASLYRLDTGAWKSLGIIPKQVLGTHYALGIVRAKPTIASLSDGKLYLWQLPQQGPWQLLGEHAIAANAVPTVPTRVLEDAGRALVFITGTTGPAELLVFTDTWHNPIFLAAQATELQFRDLGIAGGMIRFVFVEKDDIRERRISTRDFQVEGTDATLPLIKPWDVHNVVDTIQYFDMLLLAAVMLFFFSKRDRKKNKIDWKKYQLSPVGKRVFAAMIDSIPVLVMLMYVRFQLEHVEAISDIFANREAFILYAGSIALYVGHTTLIECFFGRSLGKMITGLHVLNMEGKRPNMVAMLLRNLLRVIDVTMPLVPLLVLYMPLRQRLGDMVAGTVVVEIRKEENHDPKA